MNNGFSAKIGFMTVFLGLTLAFGAAAQNPCVCSCTGTCAQSESACAAKEECKDKPGQPTCTVDAKKCGAPASAIAIPLPLGNIKPEAYVGKIIKNIIGYSGVIALLMFLYGGILYMTARGNDDQVKKGKDVIVWSVLGLMMIFAAYAIVNALVGSLAS